jgi:hypothetical protein
MRLLVAGAAVALWTTVAGFGVVAAPVLVAWLGAGAREPLVDALSVAGLGWLLGLGATVVGPDGLWGLTPLGLTLVTLALAYRGGLWAAESCALHTGTRVAVLLAATAVVSGGAAGVAAASLTLDAATVDPGDAAARAGLVVTLGATVGMLAGDARWRRRLVRGLPPWVRAALPAAVGALATLVAAAAAALTAAMVTSFGTVTSLLEQIDPGAAGLLSLALLSLAYLPTLVVWALAVLVGPGVSIGTTVSVTSAGVQPGPLPGFPVLGIVPESVPPWLGAVGAAAGLLAGIVAGGLVVRGLGADAARWHPAAGAGVAGAVTAALVGLAGWAASGPMGPGDLAWAGVEPAVVGGLTAVLVATSGALTATALTWRRLGYRPNRDDSDEFSAS